MLTRTETMTRGSTILACENGDFVQPAVGRVPAVFLDRDGTLIVDKPYLAVPDDVEILPGVVDGLRALQAAGYLLVVVTNQSVVARGYFDVDAAIQVHERIKELLTRHDVSIAAFYFCPHHLEGTVEPWIRRCPFRKPGPGMLWRAAADWSIDLKRSWMVGNAHLDIAAGRAAGCQGILVGTLSGVGFAEAARAISARAHATVPRDWP